MRVADELSNAGKLGGRWWRADKTPLLESVEIGAVQAGRERKPGTDPRLEQGDVE